jgi:hypothetical protein
MSDYIQLSSTAETEMLPMPAQDYPHPKHDVLLHINHEATDVQLPFHHLHVMLFDVAGHMIVAVAAQEFDQLLALLHTHRLHTLHSVYFF